MKVPMIKEVELPEEVIYRTILLGMYDEAKTSPDGWCKWSSFEQYIKAKFKMTMDKTERDSSLKKFLEDNMYGTSERNV